MSTIADRDPIVVMSHVPLHANRGDNPGALTWYKALTAVDLRRYSLDATEDEREYGKTGKPNPYVVTF